MMSTTRTSTDTTATAVTVEDFVMTLGDRDSLAVKIVTQLDGHDDVNLGRAEIKRGARGEESDEESVNDDRTQESTKPFSMQMV